MLAFNATAQAFPVLLSNLEGQPIVAWVIALAAVLAAVLVRQVSSRDDWASIPGPPVGSWFTGHLPQMRVPNVHRFFVECCQKYGAGGIFRLRLMHLKIVVVCEPSLVQAVVNKTNGLEWRKAPEFYDGVDEIATPEGGRSFFNTHSYDEWKLVRKATAPAFSPENIKRSFPVIRECVTEVCDLLAGRMQAGDDSIDVTEAALRITMDTIGQIGFGYDFKCRRYTPCELLEAIPPVLAEFTLRGTQPLRKPMHQLLPFLPAAAEYRKNIRICQQNWLVLLKSVRQTDVAAAEAAGDNSLRVCLARMKDPETGQPVSDALLIPQITLYLVAGFETTGHTVSWALYEIARNADAQHRIAAELAAEGLLGPGARQLEYADLTKLTYLNWVLKECMRLYPVASNGGVRKTDRPVTLGGYRLAPGTLLWYPLITLLTSSHNWERAEEFWPERWALEGQVWQPAADTQAAAAAADPAARKAPAPTPVGHASNPAKSFVPFSDGPRNCIGQSLALMEARAILAGVCGRFELSVDEARMGGHEQVKANQVMKLTLQHKGGTWLRFKLRQ